MSENKLFGNGMHSTQNAVPKHQTGWYSNTVNGGSFLQAWFFIGIGQSPYGYVTT